MAAPAGRIFIVLIGLRGSGKSSVGRLLAKRLSMTFIDLDDRTPRRLGCGTVAEAWEAAGEAAFRRAETEALREAIGEDQAGVVVALGGGTPTAPGAAELMQLARSRSQARVIYLCASARTLRDRLGRADNTHRPSLTGTGVVQEVATVLAARDPLYRNLADFVLPVDELTVEAAAASIESWLQGTH